MLFRFQKSVLGYRGECWDPFTARELLEDRLPKNRSSRVRTRTAICKTLDLFTKQSLEFGRER
jgi:hypothetical protein